MEQKVEAAHIMSPDTMAFFVDNAREKQAELDLKADPDGFASGIARNTRIIPMVKNKHVSAV